MLGRAVAVLLGDRVSPFDRADGQELTDRAALDRALRGCDVVVHLAALHPLVAPPDADERTYADANVAPFRILLDAAQAHGIRRVVLASSTSVWRDAPAGQPARFIDESSAVDGDDGYARSKIACETALASSGIRGVALRLARFARPGDPRDEIRKLYRAVDPRDIATAVLRAIHITDAGPLYAIAAPTPFLPEDGALLDADPGAAIRARTGCEPGWAPPRIGSVILSGHAERELGWHCAFPSALLRDN